MRPARPCGPCSGNRLQSWLSLQTAYDLAQARKHVNSIAFERYVPPADASTVLKGRRVAKMAAQSPLELVHGQAAGAQFFRADLHIHSYGASHDVKDAAMTPEAIVKTALDQDLALIAVTDHNEIANVAPALAAAAGKRVCVIPGVELSTGQGHLLCYLPSLENLRRFHGQLTIADSGKPNSRCQQSMLECLNLLEPLGGYAVLAHVDVESGFEIAVPGASPHKVDVLAHGRLLGIELKKADSPIAYAPGDPDAGRVAMGQARIERLGLGERQHLARVLNSDAHALVNLGRNAANATRVTRYKMENPTFDGLRIALEDADARVRIEDQIPQTIPRILGIHIDGGFLSGQTIRFSRNLNCIIGGRGTGKSTTFEAIRCLIGETSEQGDVVDSEVWPEQLHLFWQDRAGQTIALSRPKGYELINVAHPDDGPCAFDIDCFGQGDAQKISLEAQRDPLALAHYLDRFVDIEEAQSEENEARDLLLDLQTKIEEAEQKVAQIPQFQRQLITAKQQLTALQSPEVKELIELSRQLAQERSIRDEINSKVQEAKDSISQEGLSEAVKDIKTLASDGPPTVGSAEYAAILQAADAFKKTLTAAEEQVKTGLAAFEKLVIAQLASWKAKEANSQKRIDEKRRELEVKKVPFDLAYISKLTKDEASYALSVKNLTTWKPHLDQLRKQRVEALKARWTARGRVATIRECFAKLATRTLQEALTDIQVSLKYRRDAHSPEAAAQIIQAMQWRTNQQPRAALLIEHLTVPALLTAIHSNDHRPIMALRTPEDVEVFDKADAELIIERLREPAVKSALERATLYDLPRLTVAGTRPDGQGVMKHFTRDFAKLSLGQKQSVLLALMLSTNSEKPLIIDQPEDNLDGEFIYSTLVPVLRWAKERRQVIIVTHNPNVAVLGDAEQIVVMKAMNDSGSIVARGSIDHPLTRDFACAILEGAKEAFARRAKIYGKSM